MNFNAHYAYLFLTLPFLFFWVIVFIFGKKTRKEQLEISILNLPIVIIESLYLNDYWNPSSLFQFRIGPIHFLIEDFLFSFAIFGISAVIFEVFFGKKFVKIDDSGIKKVSIFPPFLAGIFVAIMLLFVGLNSVLATSIGFISISLVIIIKRKDLLVKALFSGVILMIFAFAVYFVGFNLASNSEQVLKQIWLLYGRPLGIRLFGVPLSEMFWVFSYSSVIAISYAFVKKIRTS